MERTKIEDSTDPGLFVLEVLLRLHGIDADAEHVRYWGVNRTSLMRARMSAYDPKRTLMHVVRSRGIMLLLPEGGRSHDKNSIQVTANHSGSARRLERRRHFRAGQLQVPGGLSVILPQGHPVTASALTRESMRGTMENLLAIDPPP